MYHHCIFHFKGIFQLSAYLTFQVLGKQSLKKKKFQGQLISLLNAAFDFVSSFGHCPNCDLTPPIAQIRALCGTMFLPKMRKFSKQQFWLLEWIFWQWLRSKMILRWYSDWNQGKYWWNMMKIRWLSNGLYSLKNCHKQFGQAFRPPPPFWAMPKFTRFLLGWGFP